MIETQAVFALDVDEAPLGAVRTPLCWPGGKHYQAPLLIQHLLQTPHQTFIDVFGGGASVLLRKPPVGCEVYNDIDGSLVNFWMQVRDNALALQERLRSLPYARQMLKRYRVAMNTEDALESAVRFFYVNRTAFSGIMHRGGTSFSSSSSDQVNRARAFRTATELLAVVAGRMRLVQIECQPFDVCIQRYDHHDALLYCDPPYVEEGVSCYRNGAAFGEAEHRALAELLHRAAGRCAVSYYPYPMVAELYRGWRRITYNHQRYAMNGRRASKGRHEEWLLMNYEENGVRIKL